MINKDNESIDIWFLIRKVLKEFTLLERFTFIAVFAHSHSLRTICKITKQSNVEVKSSINKIKMRIRKRLKKEGLNPNRISNIVGSFSIHEVLNNEEEDSEI